ncbi:alpha/beta fold hydrolase [Frateuria aurantia]
MSIETVDHWVQSGGHGLYVQEIPTTTRGQGDGVAVLFVHGAFSNQRLFFNHRQEGAGRYFHALGYRVFLGNMRGHGRSRWPGPPPHQWDWSFDNYVEEDIPALLGFVRQQEKGDLFVVGHGLGGYATAVTLGLFPLLQQQVAGLVLLASAINDYRDGDKGRRLELPLARLLSRIYHRMPGRKLHLGPSDEPAHLIRQFVQWARHGDFKSLDGHVDYSEMLAKVGIPVYAAVGEADTHQASSLRVRQLIERLGSTDRFVQVFGPGHGYPRRFGHYDIAAGRHADSTVFPAVEAWIRRTRGQ